MLEIKDAICHAIHKQEYSNASVKKLQLLFEDLHIDNKNKQLLQGHLLKTVIEANPLVTKEILKWTCKLYAALEDADKIKQKNEVYFSPGNDCRNAIVNRLKRAIHTVQICVFTISDDLIANEIIDCKKRGLQIKIITDDDKSFDMGSDIHRLADYGVPVKMDTSPNHMHHKFAIIDSSQLITGSYNWTRSAYISNQENIFISNDEDAIAEFQKEFNRLWELF